MPDDKRKLLYDTVSKDYNLGTFDEFNQKMDDPEKRKALYGAIGSQYNLGDYQTFDSKLAPQSNLKKVQPDAGPLPEQPKSYAQRVKAATLAPGAKLNEAFRQFGERNPTAGMANVANAGFGMLATAVSPLTEAPVIGSPLKNILGAVPWLAEKFVGLGEQGIGAGLDALKVPKNVQNLGLSDRQAQEAGNAMHNLNSNLATIPVAKGIGEIPGAVSSTAGKAALRLESSAMKQSFSGEKGIIPFDRQAQTALQKYGYSPTRSGYENVGKDLDVVNKNALKIAGRAEQQRGATIDLSEPRVQTIADAEIAKAKDSAMKREIIAAMEDVKLRVADVSSQYPDGRVPLTSAIKLKASLQDMAEKYDTPTNDLTMKQLAAKSAADQILNDITTEEPLLRSIGRKQRDLIELKNTLGRRVAVQAKADLISWGMARKIAGGAGIGYAAGGSSGAIIGALAELALDNPSIKHWTGVTLQRISNLTKRP